MGSKYAQMCNRTVAIFFRYSFRSSTVNFHGIVRVTVEKIAKCPK